MLITGYHLEQGASWNPAQRCMDHLLCARSISAKFLTTVQPCVCLLLQQMLASVLISMQASLTLPAETAAQPQTGSRLHLWNGGDEGQSITPQQLLVKLLQPCDQARWQG